MDKKSKDKALKDFMLWKAFTRDIKPIRDPNWESMAALIGENETRTAKKPQDLSESVGETIKPDLKKEVPQTPAIHFQLDRRTEEKLKKGKMPIEGTLDLHGLNQSQAHAALNQAVLMASKQNKRCLLVITGKGTNGKQSADWITPSQGVLKNRVPQWLSTAPLSYYVLRFTPAVAKHGGSGALYVYLRRQK